MRPLPLSLLATGSNSPLPAALRLVGATFCAIKKRVTVSARAAESSQLSVHSSFSPIGMLSV